MFGTNIKIDLLSGTNIKVISHNEPEEFLRD
jgi:hypothetical protein